MPKVDIKPLSVNQAWQGRRFKSKAYKKYERDLMLMLPNNLEIPEGDLVVHYVFGQSNMGADWDNPIKPFQDVLCKKYGFDDRRIVQSVTQKVKTEKGAEFVEFELFNADEYESQRVTSLEGFIRTIWGEERVDELRAKGAI